MQWWNTQSSDIAAVRKNLLRPATWRSKLQRGNFSVSALWNIKSAKSISNWTISSNRAFWKVGTLIEYRPWDSHPSWRRHTPDTMNSRYMMNNCIWSYKGMVEVHVESDILRSIRSLIVRRFNGILFRSKDTGLCICTVPFCPYNRCTPAFRYIDTWQKGMC